MTVSHCCCYEASQTERVLAVFLSHVGGPSFTAVEQGTENAYLVDMLFDTFSQVNVFPGSVGQFGHARRCVCRFFGRF